MKKFILSALLLITCMVTANAQKFALVDMEYIMQRIPAYQQATQQMESLSKNRQSQIEAKANEAKSLYEAYQKQASSLSANQRTQKEEAIIAKEGELAKKQQELIEPIQNAVYNAVKDIATLKGYDAVIDRASAQSMIFASPRIDISNEVLSKLGYSN